MHYRRVQPEDFDRIVLLQNANLSWNLDEERKSQGFLSTAFTREQFEEMNAGYGIAVCIDDSKLVGYLCATTVEFNKTLPLQNATVECLTTIPYCGKPLSSHRLGLTTPACIDRRYRGQGIFFGLCSKIVELAGSRFDIAVAFIAAANGRSLRASGRFMDVVGEFESGDRVFKVLIRDFLAKPWVPQ